jgi:hypothetical protein
VHGHVTPLPAGVLCYRCRAPLTFTSRAQRGGYRLRCTNCGCSRRNPNDRGRRWAPHPPFGVVGKSVIAVRDGERDLGLVIDGCVDALADASAPWDGNSLVVVPGDDGRPEALIEALATFEPVAVAVGSLCDLAGTQTERLQVLFDLTRVGWRVIAATDYRVAHAVTSRHLDHLDEYDDGEDLDEDDPRWWGDWDGPRSLSGRLINATASTSVHRFRPW